MLKKVSQMETLQKYIHNLHNQEPFELARKVGNPNAVILCGGGMDSFATAMRWVSEIPATWDGVTPKLILLYFNYGQRNVDNEWEAVSSQAEYIHTNFDINCVAKLVTLNWLSENNQSGDSKVDYVTYRNLSFVVEAAKFAEREGARTLGLGLIASHTMGDEIAFLDTTPQFVYAAQNALNWSSKTPVQLYAPFVLHPKFVALHSLINDLTTDDKNIYSILSTIADKTYSCYQPSKDGMHCGECSSCVGLKRAFTYAGYENPFRFRTEAVEVENLPKKTKASKKLTKPTTKVTSKSKAKKK